MKNNAFINVCDFKKPRFIKEQEASRIKLLNPFKYLL